MAPETTLLEQGSATGYAAHALEHGEGRYDKGAAAREPTLEFGRRGGVDEEVHEPVCTALQGAEGELQ